MRQKSPQSSICEVSEVTRLLTHIQQCAIDSEGTSIRSDEVFVVANLLIQRLVWQLLDDNEIGNIQISTR